MKIEIDQSGKVEDTAVKTVVGDSLGNFVVLRAKDKRSIVSLYRSADMPKIYMLHVFSLLTALLVAKTFTKSRIYVIDSEYPGREKEMRAYITEFLRQIGVALPQDMLRFERIGKASNAHKTAHDAFTMKSLKTHLSLKKLLRLLLSIPTKKDRVNVNR